MTARYNSDNSHINNTRRTVHHEPLLKVCIETFKSWINAWSIKKNTLLYALNNTVWNLGWLTLAKRKGLCHGSWKCVKKIPSGYASIPRVSQCTVITIWNLPHSLVFSTRCTWKSPAAGRSAPSKRRFPVDNNTGKWGRRSPGTRTCTHIKREIMCELKDEVYDTPTFPVTWPSRAKAPLSPPSLMASGRSILLPNTNTGTLTMVSSPRRA